MADDQNQNQDQDNQDPQHKPLFKIPEKVTKQGTVPRTPHKEAEFEILDPSMREHVRKEMHEAGDTPELQDPGVLERHLLTRELDDTALAAEERKMEEKQAALSAANYKLPFINLYGFAIKPNALEQLDETTAREAELIPFYFDGNEIRFATPNPKNKLQTDIFSKFQKKNFTLSVYYVSKSSFVNALEYYKDLVQIIETRTESVEVSSELMGQLSDHIEELKNIRDRLDKLSITEVMDIIVGTAVKLNSSDIHFEPEESDVRLRFRLDGVLQDVMTIPQSNYKQLLSRIKLISHLKVNVTQIPQDGRFSVQLPDRALDVRVSILPSGYGESIVARLLGVGTIALDIENLGLLGRAKEILMKQLERPYGMILTTGPTGSGKTTTLYSFLNYLNRPGVKIITLEDPIEYRLKGIQQTQIDRDAGLDFATGLRSILRHDPDIVLVGEIRDLETAEIAINAAQTGHVVFSTLHTNDAAGVLPRLINMGVRQFVIAPALNAVIAQRLVRILCKNCKEEYTPDKETLEYIETKLGRDNMEKYVPKDFKLFREKRCEKCATGFSGRMGVFEVFEMNDEMEKLIMRAATVAEIREQAISDGMMTMLQDGLLKAIQGITSLDEVRRVAT